MSEWKTIETAPPYDGCKRLLFRGFSTGGSIAGPVLVSGWIDTRGQPVQNYSYRLRITHWMPFPDEP